MPGPLAPSLPTVALTMGDPSGIGPEIVLKALADPDITRLARWVVVGDSRILEKATHLTGLSLEPASVRDITTLGAIGDFEFGRLDAR